MSFKCNPWLGSDDAESEHDSHIPNIHFLGFNGLLETAPEVIEHPEAEARKIEFCRQYFSDKIQGAELITKTTAGY